VAEDLHFPFPDAPDGGTLHEVAPGVNWLRMPLPFQGLDHINLWLLADGDGWTIVDCGMRSRKIQELWERIFANGLEGRPVKRLLVTHFHPDHLGLAGWLAERWNVPLWMTRTEWLFGRMLSLDAQETTPEAVMSFYRAAGMDEVTLELLRAQGFGNYRRSVTPIPDTFRRIVDGEAIEIGGRMWRVLVGHGHAPEHACFHCPELGLLISGDQVLPQISPHIGVYPNEPEANPLGEYMSSLRRYYEVPAETLVLPAHKMPFTGLHRRLDGLLDHHKKRLGLLYGACAEPKTVLETLPVLFDREFDFFERYLALGESLAHLRYLVDEGRITRESGADGIHLYRRAAAAHAA
jgi:glyoxylase-like metal-dependent hydrolase (beta-lactamase superfamily II)